jgi:hypothetical protein
MPEKTPNRVKENQRPSLARKSGPQGTEKTVDGGVPPNLVYAGITVGLLLTFTGSGLLLFQTAALLSSLMTCVGIWHCPRVLWFKGWWLMGGMDRHWCRSYGHHFVFNFAISSTTRQYL